VCSVGAAEKALGVPLALTSDEWILLASAIVPAIIAVLIYVFGLRWARRDEERLKAEEEARRERPPWPPPGSE
jgi:hypothetical protein